MTDPASAAQLAVHVARQPIFDAAHKVAGYELLYRDGAAEHGCVNDGDMASARVITDAVLLLGLDTLTDGRPAFINATRNFLLSDFATVLPAKDIVLEILETVHVDDEVVAACEKLRKAGYTLALDDYVPGGTADQLMPYVKYIKVDVLNTPPDMWAAVRSAAPPHVTLLAEKVETAEVLADAGRCGFSLFQGYYFCRPTTFSSAAPPLEQIANTRLVATLYRPDVSVARVEELIKTDVSLSYHVLRSVNSAAFATRREVKSLREALVLLGLDHVRRWAAVWALAQLGRGKSSELVVTALIRARCCERIAREIPGCDPSETFLLGLCSLLDAMIGCPMPAVVDPLPLSPAVRDALLGAQGIRRSILDAIVAYERGEWDEAAAAAAPLSVPVETIRDAYTEALTWTRAIHAADRF